MSLRKTAITAAIWEIGGKLFGSFIGLGFSIILARLLDPSQFGTIAIISGVISISSAFWDAGLGSALIQRKDVTDLHYSSFQYFNLTIGFLFFLLFFFLAPFIASFYEIPQLTNLFKVMSLLFITNSFGQVYRVKIRRNLKFSILTKTTLGGVIAGGLVCVAMAYNGYGIWSLVAQFLVSSVVSNLFLFVFLRNEKLNFAFSWRSLKELWDYGSKMFLTHIVDVLTENLDALIIGKIFVSKTLGLFYRAKSLNTFMIDYSTAGIMNVYFRIASHYQDNLEKLKEVYLKIGSIMFFATNYLVGLLFLFNKNVIILLFGEKWIEAHYYFVFLILSGLFLPIGYLTLSTIGGSGNAKLVLKLKLITKGILMLNFVFGFAFGIKGFLIGLICVNALNYFIELYFLNSLFSLPNIKIIRNQLEILTINFVIVLLINFVQIDFYLNSNFLILIIGTTIYSFLFVLSAFFFKLEALYYIIDEIPFLKNFQFRKEKFFKF